MNKISHLILLFTILFSHALSVCAIDSIVTAKAVKIEYQSINEFNNPVTLTATLTLPSTQTPIKNILLSNSATNRISGAFTQDSLESVAHWNYLVESGFAIVEPDNSVTGKESLVSVPKYTYSLAGRQTIDALSAGIKYLKDNGILTSDTYNTYNVGYGLGANLALAAQRSLEDDYSTDQKTEIHFNSTFVGGASAAPAELWMSALDNDSSYSAYKTVMMLDNILKSYAEGCMKSFSEEDVFSKKILNTYIIELIYTDNVSQAQVETFFYNTFGTRNPAVQELLSDNMNKENSAVRRAVEKALSFNNLTSGWTPQYRIYGANNDASLIKQIKGDKYTDITNDLGTIYQGDNAVIKNIYSSLTQDLATLEDQFMATVFNKIIGQTYINLPILAYYNQMFFTGNLFVDSNLKVILNLNINSLFLAKVAKMTLSLDANADGALTGGVAGTLTASCYQAGLIDFNIQATDVLPIIKNIAYLMHTKSFTSEDEAKAATVELNNAVSQFSIDINGQSNLFTGSFAPANGTTEGTYVLDLILTSNDGSGNSISFQTISHLLL